MVRTYRSEGHAKSLLSEVERVVLQHVPRNQRITPSTSDNSAILPLLEATVNRRPWLFTEIRDRPLIQCTTGYSGASDVVE